MRQAVRARVVSEITPNDPCDTATARHYPFGRRMCVASRSRGDQIFSLDLSNEASRPPQPASVEVRDRGEIFERTFRPIFKLYACPFVRPPVRCPALEQADRAIAAIVARETIGKMAILMGVAGD